MDSESTLGAYVPLLLSTPEFSDLRLKQNASQCLLGEQLDRRKFRMRSGQLVKRDDLTPRTRFHYLLQFPKRKSWARVWTIFALAALFLSVVAYMAPSFPSGQGGPTPTKARAWLAIEVFFVAIFSLDYVLRILSCPAKDIKLYLFTFTHIMEFMSCIPFLLIALFKYRALESLAVDETHNFKTALVRGFRAFRVLPLIRLGTLSLGHLNVWTHMLFKTLGSAKDSLLLLFALAIMAAGLFGTLLLYSEQELCSRASHTDLLLYNDSVPRGRGVEEGDPCLIQGFGDALWYMSATLTSVGYGDVVPESDFGRLVGIVSSFLGAIILAMPIGILTEAVNLEHKKMRRARAYLLQQRLALQLMKAEMEAGVEFVVSDDDGGAENEQGRICGKTPGLPSLCLHSAKAPTSSTCHVGGTEQNQNLEVTWKDPTHSKSITSTASPGGGDGGGEGSDVELEMALKNLPGQEGHHLKGSHVAAIRGPTIPSSTAATTPLSSIPPTAPPAVISAVSAFNGSCRGCGMSIEQRLRVSQILAVFGEVLPPHKGCSSSLWGESPAAVASTVASRLRAGDLGSSSSDEDVDGMAGGGAARGATVSTVGPTMRQGYPGGAISSRDSSPLRWPSRVNAMMGMGSVGGSFHYRRRAPSFHNQSQGSLPHLNSASSLAETAMFELVENIPSPATTGRETRQKHAAAVMGGGTLM